MGEVLPIGEMESRFESEWILVGDPELDEHLRVLRGEVLCHSKDRDEVYRKAIELRPQHAAFLFTGTIPDDMAILI